MHWGRYHLHDKSKPVVKPIMTHFLYMDREDPTKVSQWFGSFGAHSFLKPRYTACSAAALTRTAEHSFEHQK
jgi:hypothetical protein